MTDIKIPRAGDMATHELTEEFGLEPLPVTRFTTVGVYLEYLGAEIGPFKSANFTFTRKGETDDA